MFNFFNKHKISEELLQQIEETLIKADVGISSTLFVTNKLRKTKFNEELDLAQLKQTVKQVLLEDLSSYIQTSRLELINHPHIFMFVGTNGSGKTTSIAKLTNLLLQKNKKVLLVPADTFRAGATEQLTKWANELGADIYLEHIGSAPATLAYKAVEYAKANNFDAVIIDTSGRLDNNIALMDELHKIEMTIKKISPTFEDCILVLDGTLGSSSVSLARNFAKTVNVRGIIVSKLDSQSKGGFLINVIKNTQAPIYFIGVGEKKEDLKPFDYEKYLDNLLEI
jgi:fused signal recognition particle receptor